LKLAATSPQESHLHPQSNILLFWLVGENFTRSRLGVVQNTVKQWTWLKLNSGCKKCKWLALQTGLGLHLTAFW